VANRPAAAQNTTDESAAKKTATKSARSTTARAGAPKGVLLGYSSPPSEMPPTAQRLLEAARRLLERSGFNSLSVQAIGEEAGENKALIRYYFGSKDGLLVALVDWLMHDYLWVVWQHLAQLSREEQGVDLLIDEAAAGMLSDTQSYRSYFDLLPHLLSNPSMARQLSDLMQAYRDMNVRGVWDDRGEVPDVIKDLAALSVAVVDGLAIQVLAEPSKVDVPRALALWKRFISQTVAEACRVD
jgi:AcrR family transcriptional regulator